MTDRLWKVNEVEIDKVAKITENLGISPLLAKVFVSRGIEDLNVIREFLSPSIKNLYDPFMMKDMDKAVQRIVRALENKEKVLIYGDYDVDGVTSTSVLYDFLSSQGVPAGYYIPDRKEDGYGLSRATAEKIVSGDASLIITVDCGVSSIDEIETIKSSGKDVVITDHHECRETIPDAYAVINPHRRDCMYPFKELAGVGVVFKLIHGLCKVLGLGNKHLDYLDIVALGTVADVVNLIDENRIIVKYGIESLKNSLNPGLKALINVSGCTDKPINSWAISFALAPRINAAGRLGDASRAVKLFTATDVEEAEALAQQLDEINRLRQATEAEIMKQAMGLVETEVDFDKEYIIVAAAEGWHHGVLGIVASKITEKYYRPCILISIEDGIGKASARSIEGFHLFEALTRCEDILEKYGGHELAAGFTLKAENINELKSRLNEYSKKILNKELLVPRIKIDAEIAKDDINTDNVKELEYLAPFGAGNPSPVFLYDGLKVNEIRTLSDKKHLKLKLNNGICNLDAIGFNMGEKAENFLINDLVQAVCAVEINTWNSVEKVQLNLKDMKKAEKAPSNWMDVDKYIEFDRLNDYNDSNGLIKNLKKSEIEELVPERNDLAAVYRCIKLNFNNNLYIDNLFEFAKKIAAEYLINMNYFKLKKSIEIFEELKLLRKEPAGEYGLNITMLNGNMKTELENSQLYQNLQLLKVKL